MLNNVSKERGRVFLASSIQWNKKIGDDLAKLDQHIMSPEPDQKTFSKASRKANVLIDEDKRNGGTIVLLERRG